MFSWRMISGASAQRAEQRQAAISQVIAARAIVDETDHLIAELAMLKNLLGDDAAEVACAGNQDALQPEAGFPAPLEHLADELARTERQSDVDHQEQGPDDARDLIRANRLLLGRCVVRVDVERADNPENHGDDGADEDEEEVVDARPAAPQAVHTLKVVRERDEHGDERHDRDVLLERRKSSCNRDEPAREAQQVCQAECR